MQKVSLTEFRGVAVLAGPTTVVGLLIATASVNVFPPLSTQLWWRICMAIFSALALAGVLGYVLPLVHGLRFRLPWSFPKVADPNNPPASESNPEAQQLIAYGSALKHAMPLIQTYREVRALTDRLMEFSNNATAAREADKSGQTAMQNMAHRWELNARIYDATLRRDVNKMAAKLKIEYGIAPPALMEFALAQQVFGNDTDAKFTTFQAVCKDLAERIAEDLSTLSA